MHLWFTWGSNKIHLQYHFQNITLLKRPIVSFHHQSQNKNHSWRTKGFTRFIYFPTNWTVKREYLASLWSLRVFRSIWFNQRFLSIFRFICYHTLLNKLSRHKYGNLFCISGQVVGSTLAILRCIENKFKFARRFLYLKSLS